MTPPIGHRILMTTDAIGGVWVYATELARSLCAEGHTVTLVVMGPPPRPDQLAGLKDVAGLRVVLTDLALEWEDPDGADVPRARDTLLRIAERANPDVVHLNGYREAAFGWAQPVLVVAHSCVWSWWQACHGCNPSEPRWHTYRAAAASGLAAAVAWVAPTAAFRAVVDATYRPPSGGRVIWNGFGIDASASSRQPFILAAGRFWDQSKNITALAAIASSLDWPLHVAGPVENAAGGTERGIRLTCLGALPRPALLERMRAAGIFVSPALYEPFGLTVLEAAACGGALVLADIPSFRELWNDAAVFADPHDPGAFRHALQRLCRDDDLRNSLQRSAVARARRYSRHATVQAYLELYGTMATFRTPGRAPSLQRTGART